MVTPVEVILALVVLYQGVMGYLERREYKKERQELINKIMSENYKEYVVSENMKITEPTHTVETVTQSKIDEYDAIARELNDEINPWG